MDLEKILFIAQEVEPYVEGSKMAELGRKLPLQVYDSGKQVRMFMPRWGCVNERRNQLHEVIRLSGQNLILDDTDHTLVLKVASLPSSRLQVYFIDNEDYFYKRGMVADEKGREYADNVERAIFYARGVLETVKKLRWMPDIIHCQGWMSAFVPLLLKTTYKDDPIFQKAKVVCTLYGQVPKKNPAKNVRECLKLRNITDEVFAHAKIDLKSPSIYQRVAIAFSDGVIQADAGVAEDALIYAKERGVQVMTYPDTDLGEAYQSFFEEVFQV
ncbi:MAG: glycogen/starch synthase [Alloprevotella sp.]|nr:glycogen/starch synthase [Alloprevotella sp.]